MASMKLAGDNVSDSQMCYDWTRNVYSTLITLGSVVLIFYAIGDGLAALDGPPPLLMVILVAVLTLLGYLEGLQVAILALERINPEPWKLSRPRGYRNHQLSVANKGLNVQRFLVGRQFFVVFVVFVIANLTTYADLSIPWLPRWLFIPLIQTGLPGALVVLAVGQLMPQLVASSHPITFMNLPGSWFVLQLCLCFEVIGITHFSWVLTHFVRFLFGLKNGDVFVIMDETDENQDSRDGNVNFPMSFPLTSEDDFLSATNMTVENVVTADLLKTACSYGSQTVKNEEWLNNASVQSIFKSWGHTDESGSLPSVQDIVSYLVSNNQPVPRYLLPKNHPEHIPPHLIVMELCRREDAKQALKRKGY